ncbi:helix-turn-helix domain-containing protein [Streptomyces sp. NBC_00264]|nr:helix-turn-helix domain-containing protein [Streptomyces sp. NBC_00305]MCX5216633.1 helix-turn-helix domain-containing protein [Streptomyces sp. NBC_00264]
MKETAVALRISEPTVYRWIANGDLPAIRYGQPRPEGDARRGGAIRIPKGVVMALLTQPTSEVA